jgi:hypothetical protein
VTIKFKFDQNLTRATDTLHENQYTFVMKSRSLFLRKFSDSFVENIKTRILSSITLSLKKSCRLGDNVEEYITAGQATDNNTVHAHCMLDT